MYRPLRKRMPRVLEKEGLYSLRQDSGSDDVDAGHDQDVEDIFHNLRPLTLDHRP